MRSVHHRRLQARRGVVAPVTALSLTLIIAMLALVLDGGSLMAERRHAQATADAAAMAAATDLLANYSTNSGADPSGTAQTSALSTAAANGYANDGTSSTVTINVAPANYQGGPNVGLPLPAGYVEVLVQSNQLTTFSSIFSGTPVPVVARAVARGSAGAFPDGIFLMNLNKSGALTMSGSTDLVVSGASLRINSSAADAISQTGSAQVSAKSFNLVTGASAGGNLTGPDGASPTVRYGGAAPDPLRYLPAPDPDLLALPLRGEFLTVSGSRHVDLYPGFYLGGITVSGSASVTLHANSDGTPGIYYLYGIGLSVSGNGTVATATGETAGVMIYNACFDTDDAISISGSGSLSLIPPSSGTYKGVSIFQKRGTSSRSAPTISLSGSGTMNVRGTIYAAYASISVSASASSNVHGGQYIVDSLNISGSGTVKVEQGTYLLAPTRTLGLVE